MQSPDLLEVYSGKMFSVMEYRPGFKVTLVPEGFPSNEDGVGLLPSTVMVKSDGSASPPPSLTTCLVTNNVPTCDTLLGVPLDGVRGGREDWDEDEDDEDDDDEDVDD